eukprot:GHVU01047678.1.p1 GENE.GHVU01047678.1~~GHVU01047678.1.p1  ORF type:complete len:145 (-),score=5.73 GHVU01047678.1:1111-1545(-)
MRALDGNRHAAFPCIVTRRSLNFPALTIEAHAIGQHSLRRTVVQCQPLSAALYPFHGPSPAVTTPHASSSIAAAAAPLRLLQQNRQPSTHSGGRGRNSAFAVGWETCGRPAEGRTPRIPPHTSSTLHIHQATNQPTNMCAYMWK